ncbi:hypothetical protein ACQYAD_17060 [Neobacillus sp. SM06]|uniref:hypothetical protein n=1 Tax=Neobacillus sp. SM06 TaxID=3422492 RepID=UPI003D29EC25
MEEILNQILHELKGVKQDLNGVKQDLNDVKQDLNGVKQDIKDLKQGQERLETRMAKLEDGQGRLETKVDNLTLEWRSNFIDNKKVFNVASDEIKSIKVNIDYLGSKMGKHDMELNYIITRLKS